MSQRRVTVDSSVSTLRDVNGVHYFRIVFFFLGGKIKF